MTELRTQDDQYGRDYWDSMDGGRGYVDSPTWQDLAHIIKELFGIDWRTKRDVSGSINVLDVGAAFGFLVKHLRARGFDAWGVDVSTYALEYADPVAKHWMRWFDLTGKMPIEYGVPFRLVTCFETMEHIPDESVPPALEHIRNALTNDGIALFTVCLPDRHNWDSDPTHQTIRPRWWWCEQFSEAGFVMRDDLVAQLRRFWLFHDHNGVFVMFRE